MLFSEQTLCLLTGTSCSCTLLHSKADPVLSAWGLHGNVLMSNDLQGRLCEQSPAVPHVRPEPAPAAPKGTCH